MADSAQQLVMPLVQFEHRPQQNCIYTVVHGYADGAYSFGIFVTPYWEWTLGDHHQMTKGLPAGPIYRLSQTYDLEIHPTVLAIIQIGSLDARAGDMNLLRHHLSHVPSSSNYHRDRDVDYADRVWWRLAVRKLEAAGFLLCENLRKLEEECLDIAKKQQARNTACDSSMRRLAVRESKYSG